MDRKIMIYFYPFQLTPRDVLTDGTQPPGPHQFKLDANTMLIWVDLIPEAKFAHPTAYILISANNTRVEKGGWWPVLNGQNILYGQTNPIAMMSPFGLDVQTSDIKNLLASPEKIESFYVDFSKSKNVYTVINLDLSILKSNPPKLQINALGTARTTNWDNPRLQFRAVSQDAAGVFGEFDFVADPPTGIALQMISLISASHIYEGDFSKWEGVKVFSETNFMEKRFGEPQATRDTGHNLIEI